MLDLLKEDKVNAERLTGRHKYNYRQKIIDLDNSLYITNVF